MEFELTEEQGLFKDTIERFLEDNYPFDKRQAVINTAPGYSKEHWKSLAELGILALPVSEANGGLGGGAVDTMVVMERMGKALFAGPYVSSVLLAGGLLDEAGSPEEAAPVLEGVINGERLVACAFSERHAGYDIEATACRAERAGGGFKLNGRKCTVFHADTADDLIILARTSGEAGERIGLSLFLLPTKTAGMTLSIYPTQDGNRAADIELDDVIASEDALLGKEGGAYEIMDRVLDRVGAALVAEAVGIMWAVYEMTLEYLKTRTQFGETLGSFQALQHRMVDIYMMCEMAQSMAYEAAAACDGDNPEQRRKSVSAAKSLVGKYGRKVGQEGIQLHGGIGMTMEYPIGHYFKRLCMIDASFGDIAWHEARYAGITGNEKVASS